MHNNVFNQFCIAAVSFGTGESHCRCWGSQYISQHRVSTTGRQVVRPFLVSVLHFPVCRSTIVSWPVPRPASRHCAVGLACDQYRAPASARDTTAMRTSWWPDGSRAAAVADPSWSPPRYTMVAFISGRPPCAPAALTLQLHRKTHKGSEKLQVFSIMSHMYVKPLKPSTKI